MFVQIPSRIPSQIPQETGGPTTTKMNSKTSLKIELYYLNELNCSLGLSKRLFLAGNLKQHREDKGSKTEKV